MNHEAFGELSARSFLELCLRENDRRLAPYDEHLLRPTLVPSSVRFALKFIPRGADGADTAAAGKPGNGVTAALKGSDRSSPC